MSNFFKKTKTWISGHRKTSALIGIVLVSLVYWGTRVYGRSSTQTKYVIAAAQRGTIISSVTGTGQVSATNQVDIKSKVSGDVTGVYVSSGQNVLAGTLVVSVDSTDAQKSLRDAETAYTSAQIDFEKSKFQNSTDLASATQNKDQAEQDLAKAYEDAYNDIDGAVLTLPEILSNLDTILRENYLSDNYLRTAIGRIAAGNRQSVLNAYFAANTSYQAVLAKYKATPRTANQRDIESLLNQTHDTTKLVSDAVSSLKNFVEYVNGNLLRGSQSAQISADQNSLNSYNTQVTSHLSALAADQTGIESAKNTLANASQTLTEKNASLNGTQSLDLQAAELTLQEKQNALTDARQNLADYSIRAPFDGLIAAINVQRADSISSGTAVATIITKEKIAEISLNEVDIAKVKVGQKATLTFDALSDLTLTGTVAEIDSIGTVTQGVVNYKVKISFDTQDDRVKPGMSVSASIISDLKQDVVMVPLSAVKTAGGTSYVEVPNETLPSQNAANSSNSASPNAGVALTAAPKRVEVVTGFSNDDSVEIVSGLNEGDPYIARTITTSGTATTQTAPSLFGGAGARTGGFGGGGGGGAGGAGGAGRTQRAN